MKVVEALWSVRSPTGNPAKRRSSGSIYKFAKRVAISRLGGRLNPLSPFKRSSYTKPNRCRKQGSHRSHVITTNICVLIRLRARRQSLSTKRFEPSVSRVIRSEVLQHPRISLDDTSPFGPIDTNHLKGLLKHYFTYDPGPNFVEVLTRGAKFASIPDG